MKISKLSTVRIISVNGQPYNVIENKASNNNLTIVAAGGKITIVELDAAATPLITNSCAIQNMRTGVITNASYEFYSCAWTITIPTISAGSYRLLLNFTDNTQPFNLTFNLISETFQIVNFDENICEVKANDTWKHYYDGSPSIFAGRQFFYYHYFRRDYFERKVRQVSEIYDDERGVVKSLLNKSYEHLTIKGLCNEYTANCLQILSSGDFFAVKFINNNITSTLTLSQFGAFTNTKVKNSLNRIGGDYNVVNFLYRKTYEVQPQILAVINEESIRLPLSLLCLDYINPENDYFNDLLDITEIKFMSPVIPSNFLKALRKSNITQIRGSNVITEIGDNVNLDFIKEPPATPIKCDFPFLRKVGKGVSIKNINGDINIGNYDNAPIELNEFATDQPIKCFSKTFVKKSNVEVSAPELEVVECKITDVGNYSAKKIRFKDCIFVENFLTFTNDTEIINCDFAKKDSLTIDITNVSLIKGSFNKNFTDVTVIGDGSALKDVSENSFQRARIDDVNNVLGKFIAKKYRTISTISNINYHKIGNENLVSQNDTDFMTDSGELFDFFVSGINITLIPTARIVNGLLNFSSVTAITLNSELPSLDWQPNSFNNFSLKNPIKILASDFVKIIKTPNCFNGLILTNCEFYNDLPDDYDYSQIINYEMGFQNTSFINPYTVDNDADSLLINALTIYFN